MSNDEFKKSLLEIKCFFCLYVGKNNFFYTYSFFSPSKAEQNEY